MVPRLRRLLAQRTLETSIGVLFFLGAAIVTFVAVSVPHPPHIDVTGYRMLAAFDLAFAVALLRIPRHWRRRVPEVIVAVGVTVVTASLIFNGERAGGPPMLNELFYFWPAIYVGYFFGPRGAAVTIAAITAQYAWALAFIGLPAQHAAVRLTLILAVLIGMTLAAQGLRAHVHRLVGQLRTLARTDPLTEVLNRRAFDEELALEQRRLARTEEPFTLLLGDVDHFKALNDRFGHAAGDQALVAIARTLARDSRAIDTVARIGGEEFALILPGTSLRAGVEAAERLRGAIRRIDAPGAPLTMSFGVVEAMAAATSADDLLRAADGALYTAKARGRDRTVAAGGSALGAAGATA